MTTIGPVLLEIIYLLKIRTADRRVDRQTETGDLFLRTLEVMKGRKNIKVQTRLQYFPSVIQETSLEM